MPDALLKACSATCPNLCVERPCDDCRRSREAYRGSSESRGYNAKWRHFRVWFRNQLIIAGILPVCGAALPGGPPMTDSLCRARDLLNERDLHLDHDPPLTDAERAAHDATAFFDPLRVGWLCQGCHNARTRRQMSEGRV